MNSFTSVLSDYRVWLAAGLAVVGFIVINAAVDAVVE